MTHLHIIATVVITVAAAAAPQPARAQFVKGNEAVKVLPDGSRRIETPPLPKATLAAPCPAERAGCTGGGWKMVETPEGIRECTEIYARPGTCRASTYGSEKRTRLWIVKVGSEWRQCQYPDLQSVCVSTKALPTSAVQ